jgi:hypothetical protein
VNTVMNLWILQRRVIFMEFVRERNFIVWQHVILRVIFEQPFESVIAVVSVIISVFCAVNVSVF